MPMMDVHVPSLYPETSNRLMYRRNAQKITLSIPCHAIMPESLPYLSYRSSVLSSSSVPSTFSTFSTIYIYVYYLVTFANVIAIAIADVSCLKLTLCAEISSSTCLSSCTSHLRRRYEKEGCRRSSILSSDV